MKRVYQKVLFLAFILFFVFLFSEAFAKADLSVSETDLTFSKDKVFGGEAVRIYARIFNIGDIDVRGFVIFSVNKKQADEPQPISVKPNTYDDVFVDYKFEAGTYNIEAKIISQNPSDENLENNLISKKDFFVDSDSDGDSIGDKIDEDDDNDGLSDSQEEDLGTNPKMADTDGDKAKDSVDAFPKDKLEWQDTDKDGLGDNMDLDDDNDGIFDFEEEYTYGTNPKTADTDSDGLEDKKEIDAKTDPKKNDTDEDGILDSEDPFPLDASSWQAGFMNSIASFFKGREYLYYVLGGAALLIILFLFRRKRK